MEEGGVEEGGVEEGGVEGEGAVGVVAGFRGGGGWGLKGKGEGHMGLAW